MVLTMYFEWLFKNDLNQGFFHYLMTDIQNFRLFNEAKTAWEPCYLNSGIIIKTLII